MQYKEILISDITPDINQPRKFFDETAMQELTNSVMEKGIIQPVLVRPYAGAYMLVCGERRLRAAIEVNKQLPERTTISAVIKELTDDEALDMQITENLQRKDVHPMEEAVVFERMLQHNMDVKTIAAKVGKSDYFIRQRIKLCSLTDEWQKIFFANRISITDVLKVGLFDSDIQNEILKNVGNIEKIEFDEWDLTQYSGKLSIAPFNIADATLDPAVGACLNCQFNSATALLFEEAALNPLCKKISCYTNKCNVHFAIELDKALQDPAIIFCSNHYGENSKDFDIKKITAAGHKMYNRNHFQKYQDLYPDKPEFKEFEEEWLDYNDNNANGCIEAFDDAMKTWYQDEDNIAKEVTEGKFVNAFFVNGTDRGKLILVKLKKGNNHFVENSSINTDSTSSSGLKDEIARLNEKEKRFTELDEQKIWDLVKKQFNPHANASLLKQPFNQVENEAAAFALYRKLTCTAQNSFCELFKINKKTLDFSTVTDEQLRQMIRFFFLDTLPPVVLYTGYNNEALVSLKLARQYFPSVLQEVEDDQEEISTRRIAKVNAKIAELKNQIKALEPAKEKKLKKVNMKNVDC